MDINMRHLPIKISDFITLKTKHRKLFNEAYCEMYKAELFDFDSIYFKSGVYEICDNHRYMTNDPMLSVFIIKKLEDGNYSARLSEGSDTLYLIDGQWIEVPFKYCVGTRRGIINAINAWQIKRFQYVKECKHLIDGINHSNLKNI